MKIKKLFLRAFFFLTLFVLDSCSQENRDNKEIERLRNIVDSYQNSSSTKEKEKIYNKGIESADSNERILHEISIIYHSYYYDKENVKKKYDSIINSPEFDSYHPIVKYYLYYNLSNLYSYSLSAKQAFEYNIKANSYIEDDYEDYLPEKMDIQNQLQQIAIKVFDDKEEYLKLYKEQLKNREDQQDLISSRLKYNIAVNYNNLKKYDESSQYAKDVVSYFPVNSEYQLYMNSMSILSEAYSQLGYIDSMKQVQSLVKHHFLNDSISERSYYQFLIFCLDDNFNSFTDEQFKARLDSIQRFFEPKCDNRYALVETAKAEAKYYAFKKDIQKERQALIQELNYTKFCDGMNNYYIKEKSDIYNRLVDIDIELKDYKNLGKWYTEKEKVDNIKNDHTNFYVKLTQYLSEKDLSYAQTELKFEKQKVENSKKVNMLYALLISIFIISIGYIAFLYYKNVNFQEKLQQGSKLLESQNKTITEQNKKMRKLVNALTESNENLENFARVAAHDIKSPISSIHNAIAYISEKYKQKIAEDDKDIFNYLYQSTVNLSNMINVLLEYSSQNKEITKDERVSVNKVIKNVENNLKSLFDQTDAELNYATKIPDIEANEILIEQLFLNLITNAVKFSKPNIKPIVDIDFEVEENGNVLFKVSDNGIGIDQENMENIFKVFQKYHKNQDQMGSGIGLAICKKIVEDFGGKIWVESQLDIGTTFYFDLPLYSNEIENKTTS